MIRIRLAQLGAPLAGEMSSHIFFADGYYTGYNDDLYATVWPLEGLGGRGESLSQWHDVLPRPCNTPEIRIPCVDETKFAVVDAIAQALADEGMALNNDGNDGVRVDANFGWWLVRASNTQAELVIRCEAITPEGLGEARARVAVRLAGRARLCLKNSSRPHISRLGRNGEIPGKRISAATSARIVAIRDSALD